MKHAVIKTGGKQYLVKEGDVLDIELATPAPKTLEFEPLLVVDGSKVEVGTPIVGTAKVKAEVVEAVVKGEKVKIMKFKAKKRVRRLTGHRQRYTRIKISTIGK